MKSLLQTLFFFLLVTQICFAQWYQQNSGTTKNLNGTYFTNADIGVAVGDSGIILRTTNGGILWASQTSGTTQSLEKVQFVDTNVGWVVGDSGTILKTNNGGIDWVNQISGTSLDLNSVYFININNGWLVGGNYYSTGYTNGISLHTTDGGTNWITLNTDSMILLRSVYFINADTGFVVGDTSYKAIILRTTNGGVSWGSTIIYPPDVEGKGISSSQFSKLESSDCMPHNHFTFVQFTDDQSGWIVGSNDCIGPPPTGDDGIILNTNDGGISWQDNARILDIHLKSAHLVNSSTGWVAGGSLFGSPIYFTIDGGSNWSMQYPPVGLSLNDIYFIDQMSGWAVGENGTILHTTNGGVTFIEEGKTDEVLSEFLLSQNYPNPFNPSTTIKYLIPNQSKVIIKVYGILGNEIETLVNEEKSVGTYEVNWNAADLPSGVYFYQLQAGSFIKTKKMILLK